MYVTDRMMECTFDDSNRFSVVDSAVKQFMEGCCEFKEAHPELQAFGIARRGDKYHFTAKFKQGKRIKYSNFKVSDKRDELFTADVDATGSFGSDVYVQLQTLIVDRLALIMRKKMITVEVKFRK